MPMYYSSEYRKESNDNCKRDCHEDRERNYDGENRKDHDEDCKKDYCESIKGNVIDVDIMKRDCEIRADIIVGRKKKCIRLWGQVKDCDGVPVEDALVKLLKPCYKNGKIEFVGVAHTQTDCLGFYQFEICPEDEKIRFRIIVSKASKGHERVIDRNHLKCDPCRD